MRTILILILSLSSVFAFYDQKYEPPDGRVIHGLGQFVNLTFYSEEDNWQLVTEYQNSTGYIPVMYSAYAYTDPFVDELDSTDLVDIATNHTYPYVLLVGISIFDSTSSISDVNIPVQSFLAGDLDDQIIKIAREIKSLGSSPVFVRPAYEFGSGNSGLHNDGDNPDWTAENFILIWKRIYNLFQAEEVTNVAWVWNTVNPQSFNFIDWYPGDAYVDWWGINYFTTSQMSSASAFLDSAAWHQKPVIICESNPISNGGTTNPANWNDWFVPYFDQINNYNDIKAFVYISDAWDSTGYFDDWPDSRINSDATILANYTTEMAKPAYIHMDEYMSNPAILDASLPVTLTQFSTYREATYNRIEWSTAAEMENQGYNLYRAFSAVPADSQNIEYIKLNEKLIPGAGTSSAPHAYVYYDYHVQQYGYYWYSLESVDINGKRELLETQWVSRKALENKIKLYQNYPNPCNSRTKIDFYLPEREQVEISLYTINGRLVKTLLNGPVEAGTHSANVDLSNLASGIYAYRIAAKDVLSTKKMILIK